MKRLWRVARIRGSQVAHGSNPRRLSPRLACSTAALLLAWMFAGCGGPAGSETADSISEASATVATLSPSPTSAATTDTQHSSQSMTPLIKSDDEWRQILTPEQYRILRGHGTERAFTGAYWNNKEQGVYRCAGCGLELFRSEHKYDSGTGWPSYWQPAQSESIGTREDRTLFTRRTEVHCHRCSGHLGHVFDDGPAPTGLRYCINSAALTFDKQVAPSPTP